MSIAVATLVVVLVAAQARYSSLTTSRLLYEELAESVRNPVWIAHGLVYDGTSSNVGWYALVAASYKLFGFSFSTAKVFRVALQAVSLACLADLLLRSPGIRHPLVPLAVVGLSPTALTFNSMATSYGIDLQWAPILAWLIWRATSRSDGFVLRHAALGVLAMTACLMWPGCVLYIPLWIVAYVTLAHGHVRRPMAIAVVTIGFALPFLATLAFLHNSTQWLNDPASGSGVFRGGGGALVGSWQTMASNMWRVAADLGIAGSSYYFWLPQPDLSGVLGWIPAVAVIVMLPFIWRARPDARMTIAGAVAIGAGALALSGAAAGPPGLRRATGCVAAFYALYVVCWQHASQWDAGPQRWLRCVQIGALSLLLVHHVIVFAPNATSLKTDVPAVDRHWFAVEATPQASVEHWAAEVRAGQPLDCRTVDLPEESCRYAEIYAAIEAHLRWSRGVWPVRIHARDPLTAAEVELLPAGWPFGSRR